MNEEGDAWHPLFLGREPVFGVRSTPRSSGISSTTRTAGVGCASDPPRFCTSPAHAVAWNRRLPADGSRCSGGFRLACPALRCQARSLSAQRCRPVKRTPAEEHCSALRLAACSRLPARARRRWARIGPPRRLALCPADHRPRNVAGYLSHQSGWPSRQPSFATSPGSLSRKRPLPEPSARRWAGTRRYPRRYFVGALDARWMPADPAGANAIPFR